MSKAPKASPDSSNKKQNEKSSEYEAVLKEEIDSLKRARDREREQQARYQSERRAKQTYIFGTLSAILTIVGAFLAIGISIDASKAGIDILSYVKENIDLLANVVVGAVGTIAIFTVTFARSSVRSALARALDVFFGVEGSNSKHRADQFYQWNQMQLALHEINREVDNLRDIAVKPVVDSKVIEKVVQDVSRSKIVKSVEASAKEIYKQYEITRLRSAIVDDVFSSILRKIDKERQTLSLRTAMNVIAGVIIAGLGLILLWSFVNHLDTLNFELSKSIVFVSIRLSIVLFLSVFALFFLNLYRTGLSDMKYYVNEYTNISAMYTSTKIALHLNDKALLGEVCKKILETERNFILRKGEKTINLVQMENEKNFLEMLVKNVSGLNPLKQAQVTKPDSTKQK